VAHVHLLDKKDLFTTTGVPQKTQGLPITKSHQISDSTEIRNTTKNFQH